MTQTLPDDALVTLLYFKEPREFIDLCMERPDLDPYLEILRSLFASLDMFSIIASEKPWHGEKVLGIQETPGGDMSAVITEDPAGRKTANIVQVPGGSLVGAMAGAGAVEQFHISMVLQIARQYPEVLCPQACDLLDVLLTREQGILKERVGWYRDALAACLKQGMDSLWVQGLSSQRLDEPARAQALESSHLNELFEAATWEQGEGLVREHPWMEAYREVFDFVPDGSGQALRSRIMNWVRSSSQYERLRKVRADPELLSEQVISWLDQVAAAAKKNSTGFQDVHWCVKMSYGYLAGTLRECLSQGVDQAFLNTVGMDLKV